MIFLDNYDFLEPLVKEGQADKTAPFEKDGLCLADKEKNPNHVFVFHFKDGLIWATYGYTNAYNKSFLKFYREVENFIFSFNMPILRMGANPDFKNHTFSIGFLNDIEIFQYRRSY